MFVEELDRYRNRAGQLQKENARLERASSERAGLVRARLAEFDLLDPHVSFPVGLVAEDAGEDNLGLLAADVEVLNVAAERRGDSLEDHARRLRRDRRRR
jgi:hypothetical protein